METSGYVTCDPPSSFFLQFILCKEIVPNLSSFTSNQLPSLSLLLLY